jgi:hypothetical protein
MNDLGGAINQASASGSAIDTSEFFEDQIIRQWFKRFAHFEWHHRSYVIGEGSLPPRWKSLCKVFTGEDDAKRFLREVFHGHLPTQVRHLAPSLAAGPPSRDQVEHAVARALATGRAWVITKRAVPPMGKASPEVFARVNAKCNAQIDFGFLAQWEGGQILHGYVPCQKGRVAGHSGLTIATGFDIGQLSTKELNSLDIPKDLHPLLLPFAGHKFTNMSHSEAAKAVAKIGAPVPIISKSQADALDYISHLDHLRAAIAAWNLNRKPWVPTFETLPVTWQTVLFSRTFHMGKAMSRSNLAHGFYTAATTGKWKKAIKELREFHVTADWYQSRVRKEADYLDKQTLPKIVVTAQVIQEALKDATRKTQQKGGISLPLVQQYVNRLCNHEVPPPIKTDGQIIVDGNHRYVAGLIVGDEPQVQPRLGGKADQVVPWQGVKIDNKSWSDEGARLALELTKRRNGRR